MMKYLLTLLITVLFIVPPLGAQKKLVQVKGKIQLEDKAMLDDKAEILVLQGGSWEDTLTKLRIKRNGEYNFSLPDAMVAFQVFFNNPGYCSQHISVYPELGSYELDITLKKGNVHSLNANNTVLWLGKNKEVQEAAYKAENNISRFEIKMVEYFMARSKIDSSTLASNPAFANGFDLGSELSRIEEQIKNSTNAEIKKVLLIEYLCIDAVQLKVMRKKGTGVPSLALPFFKGKANIALFEESIRQVSPGSALWTFEQNGIRWLLRQVPLSEEIIQYSERMIAEQATALISASTLYGLAQRFQEEKKVEEFVIALTRLVSDYAGTAPANRAKTEFAKFSNLAIGKNVPDFAVESADKPGEFVSASSMKGKTYLIEFWTIWCKGCILAMPKLEEAYRKYHRKGFEILSIYLDKNLDMLKQFREKKYEMPWVNAFEPMGFKSDLTRDFEVSWVPRSVLVGPDGKILAVDILPADLMDKLQGFLNN